MTGHWPTTFNEDGYMTILVALMILALLTVLGVAATRSANTEVLMSGNEIRYQRSFYRAEGAAMEAADRLQNAASLADSPPAWIESTVGKLTIDTVSDYWDNNHGQGDIVIPQASEIDLNHTLYVVGTEKTGSGNSLGLGTPSIRSLSIYGRCEWDGVTTIKVGYLVAY